MDYLKGLQMLPKEKDVTFDFINDLLNYDKETGILTWKKTKNHKAKKGKEIGTEALGYRLVVIDQKRYQCHRLAWLLSTGSWPEFEIDHINGNRSDNRLSNLRDVPGGKNLENLKSARSHSSTGVLGVFPYYSNKFLSRLVVKGKIIRLGVFDTIEEAHRAYVAAKRIYHEGCTI
jgi:hypothetical protein